LKKIIIFISIFLLFGNLIAYAKVYSEHNYVIDEINNKKIAIPKVYNVKSTIVQIKGYTGKVENGQFLSKPEDLFVSKQGNIYISDTGNNRVLMLKTNGEFINEITTCNGISLNAPTGVFVSQDEHIYIADSQNSRILHLSKDFNFIEQFVAPKSDLLDENMIFQPTKIGLNPANGYIYVTYGKHFMTIDSQNRFKGFIGSKMINFTFADKIIKAFGTREQKNIIIKKEPPAYNNLFVMDSGLIYAVNEDKSSQINLINSAGNNIFPVKFYGEPTYEKMKGLVMPNITDITVDKDNFITILDGKTAKLYQYDKEGNMLCSFGDKGSTNGNLQNPTAISINENGEILVLDALSNSVIIFMPTDFILTVHKAINYSFNGEYELALKEWNAVNIKSSNYPVSKNMLGKINFKNENYSEAMKHYLVSNNRVGYGTAFEKLRYTLSSKYFVYVVIALILFAFAIKFIIKRLSKIAKHISNLLYGIERRK